MTKILEKFYLFFLIFLFAISLLIFFGFDKSLADLKVAFLDIGQGDAIFIETPNKNQILIDGGPTGKNTLRELGKLMPFFDKTIDLVILTHPHKDHIAGLIDVLKRYQISYVLAPQTTHTISEFKEWQSLIEEKDINKIKAKRGIRIHLDKNLYLDILAPFDEDELMVVSRLVYNETSFLFTGDMTAKNEYQLLSSKTIVDSDVLKVAHHGSKYSSNKTWLQVVSPFLAIISVGEKNPYSHPHPDTIERLEDLNINFLRTDNEGTIVLESDGKKIILKKGGSLQD